MSDEGHPTFKELCERILWRPMDTAPKDKFILLYCPEDESTWFAKWQGDEWFGVDDDGLRRSSSPHAVTGWQVIAWMPLPPPPPLIASHQDREKA